MLQFPLKLQEATDGEFSLQVLSKEVGGESRAAAGCLQGVSCGGAVAVSHAHTGLGTNDALDLKMEGIPSQMSYYKAATFKKDFDSFSSIYITLYM